ncbi:MAG TPA: hypothetical protein VLG27_03580, partial [Candidatus Saccharimonadia bacterium]|nr:hypothetical protein [Candidatus Saccharimonadia bacterium]
MIEHRAELSFQGPLTEQESFPIAEVTELVKREAPAVFHQPISEGQRHDLAVLMLESFGRCVDAVEPHTPERVLSLMPRDVAKSLSGALIQSNLVREQSLYPGRSSHSMRGT